MLYPSTSIRRRTYCLIATAALISLPSLVTRVDALVRPSRETERAATWRKLYDQFPEAWKSRAVVVVREVSDREMNRLVHEREDGQSRDSDDDEVQGFFEYAGPREDVPTIVLRESLSQEEASFVFTHEYGHFIWEEKLSEQERDDYFQIWNRQRRNRRLVSQYASDSVAEGFAEAFAHYIRRPSKLHKKDTLSEQFMEDWLEDHKPEQRREGR